MAETVKRGEGRKKTRGSYQVACHMLFQRYLVSTSNLHKLTCDTTGIDVSWTNRLLTERRQYTQAVGTRPGISDSAGKKKHGKMEQGVKGFCCPSSKVVCSLTMIHLAPLLWILGGARRCCRRRISRRGLRRLARPIPVAIVLHDIGSGARRLPFNVCCSGCV